MTFTIAWSPDGSRLASIGMAYATIFDMQTRTALVRIGELPDRRTLLWVTWSPDGTRVATPGLEGLAYLWDATTGDLLMILQSNDTEQVYQVEWQPGGNLLVGLNDYALIFWDTTTGQQVGRLATPDRAVHVAWSPDGTQLAYGGAMGSDLSMVSVEQIVNAP
jgi:WD40 repeat protein